MDNFIHISNLIKHQFPDFYKSEGKTFIQFLKAYYEWEETRSKAREFPKINDVDSTEEEYLSHFINEYLLSIPENLLKDKRLFVKHALDLYRSKGSIESVRLVFRILFDEEIDVYIPSFDIFKPDDSVYYEPRYIEIDTLENNRFLNGESIRGVDSNATAIVERYERVFLYDSKAVDVLYLSNIMGEFKIGEKISSSAIPADSYPRILGSPDRIEILNSKSGFSLGNEIVSNNSLKGTVVHTTSKDGIIDFILDNGGWGYSLDNVIVSVNTGTNTSGSGANFVVTEITDVKIRPISDILIEDYLGVELDAENFDYGGDTSAMATANIESIIYPSLEYVDIPFGSISVIDVTNEGSGYDGDVSVHVYDPVYLANFTTANSETGTFDGNNAVIFGFAAFGDGVVDDLKIIDSGFGYSSNQGVTLQSTANNAKTVGGRIILGAVGRQEGFWKTENSALDKGAFLQDDDYYQEYSYVIKSINRLNTYNEMIKRIIHPSGNKYINRLKITIQN